MHQRARQIFYLCSEKATSGGFRSERETKSRAFARFSTSEVIRVDVNVWQELEQFAFGTLHHPVGRCRGHPDSPGNTSNSLDFALFCHLHWFETFSNRALENNLSTSSGSCATLGNAQFKSSVVRKETSQDRKTGSLDPVWTGILLVVSDSSEDQM